MIESSNDVGGEAGNEASDDGGDDGGDDGFVDTSAFSPPLSSNYLQDFQDEVWRDLEIERLEREAELTRIATTKLAYKRVKFHCVNKYLYRLSATADGRLICRDHPSCDLRNEGAASLDSLKVHFFHHHRKDWRGDGSEDFRQAWNGVEDALDDSWVAGRVKWLTKMVSIRSRKWARMTMDERPEAPTIESLAKEDHEALGIHRRHLRRMSQWRVLRDLRQRFYQQHTRFHDLARKQPSIAWFAERIEDAGKLLHLAVDAFQDVLRGRQPTTLQQVFAFVSLAYAMNDVMRARGLPGNLEPNVQDFFSWRVHIIDEDERKTFDQIVICHFVPDTVSILNMTSGPISSQANLPPEASTPIEDLQALWDSMARGLPLLRSDRLTSMRDMVLRLMNVEPLDSGFNFSAFLSLNSMLPATGDIEGSRQGQSRTGGTSPWTDRSSESQIWGPTDRPLERPADPAPTLGDCATVPLVETVIFLTARRFMICE